MWVGSVLAVVQECPQDWQCIAARPALAGTRELATDGRANPEFSQADEVGQLFAGQPLPVTQRANHPRAKVFVVVAVAGVLGGERPHELPRCHESPERFESGL